MVIPMPQDKKLFGAKKQAPAPQDAEMLNDLANLTRRLRVMEEQYTNIRRRISVLDENMLSYGKKLKDEVNVVNSDFSELKKAIEEMDDKLILVIRELKRAANKQEVEVLKKYISIWEPLNFVTRSEVEKIIADILGQKAEKKD